MPGIDGVRWEEYESGLEDRLIDLHSRVHRGAYRAKPSRRVFIPKADRRQRPLGVAALEDKIVQQAVVTILNQIYEIDFRGFSYGFRPGRSPHQALDRGEKRSRGNPRGMSPCARSRGPHRGVHPEAGGSWLCVQHEEDGANALYLRR